MTTNTASGAADLRALIEAYAEARHRHGHSSYNAQSAASLKAVKEAMQETEATHLRELAAYRLTVENLEREIAAQQPAPSAAPATFLRGVIDLCTQKGFSPENIEAWDSEDKWIADIWRQARELLAAPADSVQEDAARYRWLREGNDAKHGAAWHVAVNLYGCEWDAAIDAARKQGATK